MPRIIYDARELCDILLIYGEAGGNASLALDLYRERYPNRNHPRNGRVITNAVQRVRDNQPVMTPWQIITIIFQKMFKA